MGGCIHRFPFLRCPNLASFSTHRFRREFQSLRLQAFYSLFCSGVATASPSLVGCFSTPKTHPHLPDDEMSVQPRTPDAEALYRLFPIFWECTFPLGFYIRLRRESSSAAFRYEQRQLSPIVQRLKLTPRNERFRARNVGLHPWIFPGSKQPLSEYSSDYRQKIAVGFEES